MYRMSPLYCLTENVPLWTFNHFDRKSCFSFLKWGGGWKTEMRKGGGEVKM